MESYAIPGRVPARRRGQHRLVLIAAALLSGAWATSHYIDAVQWRQQTTAARAILLDQHADAAQVRFAMQTVRAEVFDLIDSVAARCDDPDESISANARSVLRKIKERSGR